MSEKISEALKKVESEYLKNKNIKVSESNKIAIEAQEHAVSKLKTEYQNWKVKFEQDKSKNIL